MPPLRAAYAEFVGTFGLVFVGGGAMILTKAMPDGAGGLLTIAMAHGLILAVMVSATLHISGGQINPAVSIVLAAIRKQSWHYAGVFAIAQLLAAIVAAYLLQTLFALLPNAEGAGTAVEAAKLGATLGALDLNAGLVFALEVIATFFLMFVIMGTIVDQRGVGQNAAVGGFAIGLVVAADILCFGPMTGASMNPARSFGPALIGGHWTMHYVYWLAPMTGALLAALSYHIVFSSRDNQSRAGDDEGAA